MDGQGADDQSGKPAADRPSREDRCSECGHALNGEWVSYRQDPGDPQRLVQHFGAIVRIGPIEPRPERPSRTTRDFHYPEDLGLFFHPSCAPRSKLPETVHEGLAKLLADAIVDAHRKTLERWASLPDLAGVGRDGPRCRGLVASIDGRRVFTLSRPEWERLRAHERQLVEIDLERPPARGVEEAASAIASLAAEYSIHTERLEVWRYHATDPPTPSNVQDYLVLDHQIGRAHV